MKLCGILQEKIPYHTGFVRKCFLPFYNFISHARLSAAVLRSVIYVMHLSSASPRGGGDPRADVGTLRISCVSPSVGDFFLAKSPVFGEAKHPTGFEDVLQNFIWLFEQLANTRTLHSDAN